MKKNQHETWAEVQGVECDVICSYDSSPPEPDVNWGGDFTLTEVSLKTGGSVIDEMTDQEIEDLTERVENDLNDLGSDDGYGDYLYDRMVDDKLTGDF